MYGSVFYRIGCCLEFNTDAMCNRLCVFKLNVEMTLMLAYFITLVLYLIFSIYIKNSVTEVIVPINYDAHNNLNSSIVFFMTGLSQLILMLPTFLRVLFC